MGRGRVPAAVLCTLLSACGPTGGRVVHYYNWANYIGPDTIPAFEAATGIKVIYDAYDAEETLADPALYPPPDVEARLYFSLPVTEKVRRLRTRTWTRIKTGH